MLPVVRALDARGRRKRAVDFFDDTFTSARGTSSRSNKSKHGSDAMEVLEKAYHAAEALTNKTAAETATAENHDTSSFSPSLDERHSRDGESDKRDAPVRSSMKSMLEPESNTGDPSITLKITQQKSNQHHDMEGRPNPFRQEQYSSAPESQDDDDEHDRDGRGQNDDHGRDRDGEEGARGVEAEGLIWVDDSQTTAYSVRYLLHVGVVYQGLLGTNSEIHFDLWSSDKCM